MAFVFKLLQTKRSVNTDGKVGAAPRRLQGGTSMTLRSETASLVLFLAPCLVLTALGGAARADDCLHCPKTVFYRPKPPHIKFKCVCPRPISSCDALENFGYYQTCWHAWPFPPNYSHCPILPTIATAPSAPNATPAPLEQLPPPKTVPSKPSLQ
jgi:hypothetical protein